MLFIPANNSATGVFQLLSENDGSGLIFETEGDTLSHSFKSDYGNFSDGLRKASHHEPISFFRRKDNEYVDWIAIYKDGRYNMWNLLQMVEYIYSNGGGD